ncbi:formylglycine-generating enzyme family protein [Chamaesiphon minutus]|uniref:Sulfatase-modifying factor enzyme-like domain-containing protein n=1 Tax=Chamaesiphon minutus (strain ATCC 27169 / PCC 6605) TaxID=1173020 RepID=K9UDM3_CHAP6|nr:formylglycine-generating enzyme family protein [Chamaesiphon minutus]AFY92289.1 hypothetical protein Cha6605_1056 [Chamaesiphon minutus PCC 6605]
MSIPPNPNNTDAILGGQNPLPVNAGILGGIAGAKKKLVHDLELSIEAAHELIDNHDLLEFETITVNSFGKVITSTKKYAFYYTEKLENDVAIDMMYIPSGNWNLECTEGNKKWLHQISIKQFYLSKSPITKAQYQAVMGNNPSFFKGEDRCPVESVTWKDAIDFCERLSNLTGKNYTLPSESQWQYAFVSGTNTPIYCGDTITTDLSNYNGKQYKFRNEPTGVYLGKTTPVGKYPPTPWGLYDMHGNVMEWCLDEWHENLIDKPIDGTAWKWRDDNDGQYHIFCGCSYKFFPLDLRGSNCTYITAGDRYSDIGFRVCRI